jgi:hydrogenase maturation factor
MCLGVPGQLEEVFEKGGLARGPLLGTRVSRAVREQLP